MINLISEEQKIFLRRNYKMRLIVLIFSFLCLFIFISVAFVLPPFFLSLEKEKIAKIKLNTLKDSENILSSQELEAIISDTNGKLSFLKNSEKDSFGV